jgi:hypothetical protein
MKYGKAEGFKLIILAVYSIQEKGGGALILYIYNVVV